ncbi:MAG: hypothetical protein A4E45_00030 [Methanosaeta sp. PtaB.Bin039]|nr:MAG: hypothetical protein A4E45_00030 [Methanosaeta sp. PtaB.Bin039]
MKRILNYSQPSEGGSPVKPARAHPFLEYRIFLRAARPPGKPALRNCRGFADQITKISTVKFRVLVLHGIFI